jgi:hypothetical protein
MVAAGKFYRGAVMQNGKPQKTIVKRSGIRPKTSGRTNVTCDYTYGGVFEQHCIAIIQRDNVIDVICGDWELIEIWYDEYNCHDDLGDCLTGGQQTAEQCACMFLGSCENDDDPEKSCNKSDEEAASEAQNIVDAAQVSFDISPGEETGAGLDELGQNTPTKLPSRDFYRANAPGAFSWEYSAYYTAVHVQETGSTIWKFKSFTCNSACQSSGNLPPCVQMDLTINNHAESIDADKKHANADLNFTLTAKIQGLNWQIETRTITGHNQFIPI